MAIFLVANEKGGTGKTTVASNLAIMRAQHGRDVLLIDADPQGSSTEFIKVREDEQVSPTVSCVAVTGRSVATETRKLMPRYQDIIIDAGGRDSVGMRSALTIADVLVIPFLASQFDLWAVENMDTIVGDALGINPDLKAYLVINKHDTNPRIAMGNEVSGIASELQNLTILNTKIGYRIAYRRSSAEGRAVNELDKRDPKAIGEMEALYKEVTSWQQ